MGYEERWEAERNEGYHNRNPAAVAAVIALCFLVLGGIVLAVVYGAAVWALLFVAVAIGGVVAAVARGNRH